VVFLGALIRFCQGFCCRLFRLGFLENGQLYSRTGTLLKAVYVSSVLWSADIRFLHATFHPWVSLYRRSCVRLEEARAVNSIVSIESVPFEYRFQLLRLFGVCYIDIGSVSLVYLILR
jgi:hypothetical protein